MPNRDRKHKINAFLEAFGFRKCTVCNTTKFVSNYYRSNGCSCKACVASKSKDRYQRKTRQSRKPHKP